MKLLHALALSTALGLTACASLPVEIESTSVETELELAYQNTAPNDTVTQLSVLPQLELNLGKDMALVMSGRARFDAANDLDPGEPNLRNYSRYSRPLTLGNSGTFELRDFYIEFDTDAINWRVGKQQIVWGELDGFKNLDAVNPQSFREFILDDFESSRIGLWSVNANFKLNGWNAQIFWAPDATVHEAPVQGSTFALTAPRYTFNASELGFLESQTNYPSDTLSNAAYGARFNTLTNSGVEISLSYLSGLDHTSVGRSDDEQTDRLLIQEYQHREVLGFSISKAVRNLVLRSELG